MQDRRIMRPGEGGSGKNGPVSGHPTRRGAAISPIPGRDAAPKTPRTLHAQTLTKPERLSANL